MKKQLFYIFLFFFVSFSVYFVLKNKFLNLNKQEILKIIDYNESHKKEILSMINDNWWWLVHGKNRLSLANKNNYDFEKQLDLKKAIYSHNPDINLNIKVLVENNKVCAFSSYFEYEPKIGFIQFLCVEKNSRRKHYSEKLIINILKELFEKDYLAVWLNTRTENIKALNLYKKLGFVEFNPHEEEIGNEEKDNEAVYLIIKKEDFKF